MVAAASSARQPHHHHLLRRRGAAAGLGGLGTMLLLNTARAFLVRLPLSFGPPIAHPYQATVRWASSAASSASSASSTPSSPPSPPAAAAAAEATSSSPGGGPTPITLPKAVSPSSLGDFKTCPRLYRFRHVERLPEPASEVMVRGSMVHDALDQLFLQPPANRTEAVLHDLFRAVWLKRKDKYMEELFPTVDQQRAFGLAGLKLLSNYYKVEAPQAVEPLMREHRMRVPLAGGPNVTGILDRVDEQEPKGGGGGGGEKELVVVDYKTGKAPALRYSNAVNQRIIIDKFFQLKIYALLLLETTGRLPTELKLIYLDGPTVMKMKLLPEDVEEARHELTSMWDQICAAASQDAFPTKPGKICDWCSFKGICPAWNFPSPAAAGAGAGAELLVGAGDEGVTGPEADIAVAVESVDAGGLVGGMVAMGGPRGSGGPLGGLGDGDGSDGEGEGGPASSSSSGGRKAGPGGAGTDDGGGPAPAATAAVAEAGAPAPARKRAAATGTRKPRTSSSSTSSTSTTTAATATARPRRRKAAAKDEGAMDEQQQQQQQLLESLAELADAAASLSASSGGGRVAQAAAEGRA